MATASGNNPKQDTPEDMVSSFFSSQSEPSPVPSDVDQQAAADKVSRYNPRGDDDNTEQILSSFLTFLPAEGKQILAEFVVRDSVNNNGLNSLASHLLTSILLPMKARGVTPDVTPSPFPDNDDTVTEIAASLDEPVTRAGQRGLKKLCLERDGFRCLATGFVEKTTSQKAPGLRSVPTELAHIVPFSLGRWGDTDQDHFISQKWATLTKCFPNIGLSPNQINQPKNLMTLMGTAHQAFGGFNLIFEPMEEADKYNILPIGSGYPTMLDLILITPNAEGDRIVKFESHNNVDLPSRNLLQTHAALAKILHASGMAERIDKVMEERDDIRGLASDGSSNVQKLLFAY